MNKQNVLIKKKLKEWRAFYELSQPKGAEVFGVSVATLRSWEQGARKPDPWFLLQTLLYGDVRAVGVSRDMLASFGDGYKLP